MGLQDGRAFERLVREAVEQIKPDEGVKVTFDVAKAADGTAIHQITGPFDEKDARPGQAFRQGLAILRLPGRCRPDRVRRGQPGAAPAGPRGTPRPRLPPARSGRSPLVARVAALGEFAEENQEALRRAAAEVFQGEGVKRDRISLGIKGEGDGIRLRLAIDVPALKLFYLLGQEMQR